VSRADDPRRGSARAIALAAAAATALGAAACARLLGLREPGPHVFEHRAHVVAGVSCAACHRGVERAGDLGPLHFPDATRCLDCHARPHDPRPCGGCHGAPFAAVGALQAREHIRFSHAAHVPALRGSCVRCHVDVARDDALLRPAMATCTGCHEHRDQLADRDCDGCHVDLARELRPPESHLVHDGDFLREHGVVAASSRELCSSCHTDSSCASCHGATTPALPSAIAFDDPVAASVHRAGFLARHAEESRAQPGLCTTCHREESCSGCHAERGIAASGAGAAAATGSPHPPGWVGVGPGRNEHGRAARVDPAACASCHGGAGEMLCVGCHRVGGIGGSPHPPGWSSRQRRTADLPCRLCHPGSG
jgi:hypothetical protein